MAGQKYRFSDAKLNDEVSNIYYEMGKAPLLYELQSYTKAQLTSSIPRKVGKLYYCTDCTTDAMVISTGTAIGAVSRVSARTTAIQ